MDAFRLTQYAAMNTLRMSGGYLSRQELSARLSMLKTAQTRRLLSRSAAAQTSGRLDPDHNDGEQLRYARQNSYHGPFAPSSHMSFAFAAGVDDDDSEVSVASQRDAATHHAEAAVMAAYRRRSVERRSADIPRALEVKPRPSCAHSSLWTRICASLAYMTVATYLRTKAAHLQAIAEGASR